MTTASLLAPAPRQASVDSDSRQLMSGDEAVAWAAVDAGICFASAYPGTPATDIQEALGRISDPARVRTVWSINEKVAYESALAVGIAGKRALVSMKHVGLNVASDAFISSCLGGTNGGLVLAVADDPECQNSQNKQDSRYYRALSETLLLDPADSQEAYSMCRSAFRLSERFSIPVLLRLTSRTAYGSTPVKREPPEQHIGEPKWTKDHRRFFIVPSNSRPRGRLLRSLQRELLQVISAEPISACHRSSATEGHRLGVVCTGIGFAFAREMLPMDAGYLKIGGEPFPDSDIADFVAAHDRIVVLEDGDPILEQRVRSISNGTCKIQGRLSGALNSVGELQPEQIQAAISNTECPVPLSLPGLPVRFPEICKPCGYHKVFAALKDLPNIATPSDIGCNSLGGLPPYTVMDGLWSMGSSIGVACGLAAIGIPRIVAIIGDSTFLHAGIPALIEAVHEGYTLTVLLLDNGAAAMTGGQGVAHRAAKPSQNTVDIVKVIEAVGVKRCIPFDPHRLGQSGIKALLEESFTVPGVSVLLYRSQCGLYSPGYQTQPQGATATTKKKE